MIVRPSHIHSHLFVGLTNNLGGDVNKYILYTYISDIVMDVLHSLHVLVSRSGLSEVGMLQL